MAQTEDGLLIAVNVRLKSCNEQELVFIDLKKQEMVEKVVLDARFSFKFSYRSGKIYLSDKKEKQLQILDMAGNLLAQFGATTLFKDQLEEPGDSVVFRDNSFLVSNTASNTVQVYGPGYELVGSLGLADGLVRPTGIFLDSGNRVMAINA